MFFPKKMELWSIWLFGFTLIGLSFYTTLISPPLLTQIINNGVSHYDDLASPRITIFSAPRPFSGSVAESQSLAVRSWLGLSPRITAVLFSRHSSVFSFARPFGSRVLVEPNIDFTFLGTPFFHSMMSKSRSFESDIYVFVHIETELFSDFVSAMNYASKLDRDWLLYASVQTKKDHPNTSLRKKLMAWNNREISLYSAVLPPFLYGRGVHDEWVLTEALSSGFRFVFDASLVISSLNNADDDRDHERSSGWEYAGNSILGTLYGSSFYRKFNHSDVTKLVKSGGRYRFHKLGYDNVSLSDWSSAMGLNGSEEALEFPFSLESLLEIMADKNQTVVVAVAGFSYKEMLMSWVCRLRRLNVTSFVVAALDKELYRFSILQGLPVFSVELAPSNISFNNCHFGTKCFQRVTKVKSRTVLKILKMGYNVLLSDVDVYWFKNSLPFLSSFGPSVLVAQSEEYNKKGPINLPKKLNSGFYFARADAATVAGLEKVVKHAENSGLSEQPSFYDVLCGEKGSKRAGKDRCFEPETNLTVQFLDRNLFPNGAYLNIWKKNPRSYCKKSGCFVLHNNWISGRKNKLKRQVSTGLWEYDMTTRMCLQS